MKYFEHLALLKNINGIGIARVNTLYEQAIKAYEDIDVFADYVAEKEELSDYELRDAKEKARGETNSLEYLPNISVTTCFDKEYPSKLKVLGNQKPLLLYYVGDISMLDDATIAVVGTRKPSAYGISANKKITEQLKDVVVVSGLALGTDRIAHETALRQGGKTVAVLPSGIMNIMPASNRELANEIAEGNGCIVSEYGPKDPAVQHTYVRRDSLIAALSDGVVVIECGEKSGTMHTANAAIKLHKPLACYYTDRGGDYSGNKLLIDQGKALRLMSPEDVRKLIDTAESAESRNNLTGTQLSFFDTE